MKTQHTPGPWHLNRIGNELYVEHYSENGEMPFICDMQMSDCVALNRSIVPEIEANAEFIVRACNSHYELVEALKECITDPNAHCLVTDTRDALFKRIEAINTIARKALSQATK